MVFTIKFSPHLPRHLYAEESASPRCASHTWIRHPLWERLQLPGFSSLTSLLSENHSMFRIETKLRTNKHGQILSNQISILDLIEWWGRELHGTMIHDVNHNWGWEGILWHVCCFENERLLASYSWSTTIIGSHYGFSFTHFTFGESDLAMKRFKILWFLSQAKALQYCGDETIWCNGVKDCIDGRDEVGCANYVCANPDVSKTLIKLGF